MDEPLPEVIVCYVTRRAEKDGPNELGEYHQPQLGRVECFEEEVFRLGKGDSPVQSVGPAAGRDGDQVASALSRCDHHCANIHRPFFSTNDP